jgi:NTE family protein
MAFHLGCLRALRSEGLLDEVSTISAVSGGSVVAALYCSYPG